MLTRDLLKEFYSTDQAFLDSYHEEAGKGLEACVDRSWSDFEKAKAEFQLFYHKNQLVGFFGKERSLIGHALSGFFILPEFRNKEVLSAFWNTIMSNFPDFFWVGMGDNNTPAHKFIERNGGKKLMTETDGVFYLVEKGE